MHASECNIFALFFNDEILNVLVTYFCHSGVLTLALGDVFAKTNPVPRENKL